METQINAPPAAPVGRDLGKWARHPGVICLVLAGATLAAFWPVLGCGFLSFDDPTYFCDNDHVLGGLSRLNFAWAFRSFEGSNWHPVTWLSHMLDAELFGKGPTGPHCVNLAFHVVNALLLFRLLGNTTGAYGRSALVAALFALHPLHVESVAWIAERKDVLSTFFLLLTLWAYARYAKAPVIGGSGDGRVTSDARLELPAVSIRTHASRYYALSLLFFALGLMSKPMLVTLPCVMMLLDFWPLARLRRSTWRCLLREKAPFLAMSAASSVVTILAQRTAMPSVAALPVPARLANALVAYARYLGKTICPLDLALPYPHPGTWPFMTVAMAALVVGVLCFCALRWAGRWPFLLTGWFWFCGTLVPVIGLVQVGQQSMADRYSYVPLIGLFIILAWGGATVSDHWRLPKGALAVVVVGGLAACGLLARQQAGYWTSGERLFRHAAAVTKDNFVALNLIGVSLEKDKRLEAAIDYYRNALRLNPGYADAQFNLGNALVAQKQYGEAVGSFEATLRVMPWYYEARNNLANTLVKLGRLEEAAAQYQMALKHAPEASRIHENLAAVQASQGKFDEAIAHYRLALAQRPDSAGIHYALGLALAMRAEWGEATREYSEALRLAPGNAEAEYNLGYAFRMTKQLDEAKTHLEKALRLRPEFPLAHYNLGCVLAEQGRREEAVVHLREALKLKSDYEEARQKLRELGEKQLD